MKYIRLYGNDYQTTITRVKYKVMITKQRGDPVLCIMYHSIIINCLGMIGIGIGIGIWIGTCSGSGSLVSVILVMPRTIDTVLGLV